MSLSETEQLVGILEQALDSEYGLKVRAVDGDALCRRLRSLCQRLRYDLKRREFSALTIGPSPHDENLVYIQKDTDEILQSAERELSAEEE